MQGLKSNLVVLDVSSNRNLSDEDWKTVGEMTKLERLDIRGCDIQTEVITKHMQSLKNNIVELDVSKNKNLSNEDWKTVGEMTRLEWLNISYCDIQAGTITKHMQSLKNNLVEMDVSCNTNLSDEDWKTVGEMTRFKRLNIRFCYVKPGTIAHHMQSLKNNLVELDVMWNEKLSDEDWKTVGEMTRLKRLDISGCNVKAGMIAQHMQSLKNTLVELDISENRDLSDEDWETIGVMIRLEKLYMIRCNIQAGKIAECMQSLNLVKLNVSWNRDLSEVDWKTLGEMTRLEKLNIRGCDIQTKVIAKHMQSLKNILVELDISYNTNLSDEDWKRVGEMTRLERLNIRGCDVQEEFSRYLGGLRCCIVE
eukprot:jgi/Antlo1/1222/2519